MIDKLVVDDKTSEPYYKQLIRHIEQMIESGEIVHGLGLPSERDLAKALSLSRTTIKRCYDELRRVGLLNVHGRGGTSVNKPTLANEPLSRLKTFAEEMEAIGRLASTRLEGLEICMDRTIASVFQLPSNASFLRIVRVQLADGMPITREIAWYDLSAAPKLEAWNTSGSIYAFLQEFCHVTLSWTEQSIEAMLSSDIETKIFGFNQCSPCLLIKRRTYSTESKLIEYVESTFRGDAYAYQSKLGI
jgi:GntR family transcriptional regulator